ncbi:hypothetical protein C8R47DRAFT_511796 [Mycena vitilis]|nr:hypothetical protein C8R47DRAFT_511796 [Mycena vitilis]
MVLSITTMLCPANLVLLFGFVTLSWATWNIPRQESAIESRTTTTLTNGSSIVFGKVGNMTWGASGILTQGCSSESTIQNCYGMYLTSNASEMLDTSHLDSPRQRNEWHFPTVALNQSFSYSWKQYIDKSAGSSSHFFHMMQVYGIPENGPIVACDALKDNLQMVDFTNPLCGSSCPSTPLFKYLNIYTTHAVSGKFGPFGGLNYTVTDPNGKEILSYSRVSGLGTGDGYIKFGTYRMAYAPGMSVVNTMVGDWKTYY